MYVFGKETDLKRRMVSRKVGINPTMEEDLPQTYRCTSVGGRRKHFVPLKTYKDLVDRH